MKRSISLIFLALAVSVVPIAAQAQCVTGAANPGAGPGYVTVEFANSCSSSAVFTVDVTITDRAGVVHVTDTEPTTLERRGKNTLRFGYPRNFVAPVTVGIVISER